jgi:hypothetical protein
MKMQTTIKNLESGLIEHFENYDYDFTGAIAFYINELKEREDNYDDIEAVISDFSHGCSSGIVGSLTYYDDTEKFFLAHKQGIVELLNELQDDCGEPWMDILNGYDMDDMFCEEINNRNLLAWYLFEEINNRAEMIIEDMEEEQ